MSRAVLALLLLVVAPTKLEGVRVKGEEEPDDDLQEEVDEDGEDNTGFQDGGEDAVEDEVPVQDDAPDSFLGDGPGIELLADDDEGTTIFRADESSEVVQAIAIENPEADVKSVLEIRTKLKFTSNKETLKNPELVERIVSDIKEQQDGMQDMNLVFCLHVGTTQVDRILTTRPGFMEGRVGSVKEALQPDGEIPGVEGAVAAEFMHFQSTRFAGLIMLAYSGESAPECAKDQMKPPRALRGAS